MNKLNSRKVSSLLLTTLSEKNKFSASKGKPTEAADFLLGDEEQATKATADAYWEVTGITGIMIYRGSRWYWTNFKGFKKSHTIKSVDSPNGPIKQKAFKDTYRNPNSPLWDNKSNFSKSKKIKWGWPGPKSSRSVGSDRERSETGSETKGRRRKRGDDDVTTYFFVDLDFFFFFFIFFVE